MGHREDPPVGVDQPLPAINDVPDPRDEVAIYRDLISDSPAFHWLLTSLKKEMSLSPAEPDVIGAIRRDILDSLKTSVPTKVSRKTSAVPYSALFDLDWNPIAFWLQQDYQGHPYEGIGKVITLSGSVENAQALTCERYVQQTWPSIGLDILDLVRSVMPNGSARNSRTLSDGTKVMASRDEWRFKVKVTGTKDSIVQIGEQVAWLGTALRSSPNDLGISFCVPFISKTFISDGPSHPTGTLSVPTSGYLINFTIDALAKRSEAQENGRCWYNIFRNPIVVRGFPIPRRLESASGLEIPLEMMAALIETNRINQFRDTLYLKGFSSMLVAVAQTTNFILWHFYCDNGGGRISYLEHKITTSQNRPSMSDLGRCRHIVGWLLEAKCLAGRPPEVGHQMFVWR